MLYYRNILYSSKNITLYLLFVLFLYFYIFLYIFFICLFVLQAIQDLHVGALPAEDQLSPDEITTHIMKHTTSDHPGRIYKEEFIKAAMTSNTLAAILQGTVKAADSPYLRRKERRGSLGIPLHHVVEKHPDQNVHHQMQPEVSKYY